MTAIRACFVFYAETRKGPAEMKALHHYLQIRNSILNRGSTSYVARPGAALWLPLCEYDVRRVQRFMCPRRDAELLRHYGMDGGWGQNESLSKGLWDWRLRVGTIDSTPGSQNVTLHRQTALSHVPRGDGPETRSEVALPAKGTKGPVGTHASHTVVFPMIPRTMPAKFRTLTKRLALHVESLWVCQAV